MKDRHDCFLGIRDPWDQAAPAVFNLFSRHGSRRRDGAPARHGGHHRASTVRLPLASPTSVACRCPSAKAAAAADSEPLSGGAGRECGTPSCHPMATRRGLFDGVGFIRSVTEPA